MILQTIFGKKYHNPNHIYNYAHSYNVTIILLKSYKIIKIREPMITTVTENVRLVYGLHMALDLINNNKLNEYFPTGVCVYLEIVMFIDSVTMISIHLTTVY